MAERDVIEECLTCKWFVPGDSDGICMSGGPFLSDERTYVQETDKCDGYDMARQHAEAAAARNA